MTKDEALSAKHEGATTVALKLALEAMRFALHVGFDESSESQIKKGDKAVRQHEAAITAIREALAQPERTWVGLTVEDKKEYLAQDFGGSRADAMDWTEQRLKEKNT